MPTKKIDTDRFSDETEVWQKSLAILTGVREVLSELRTQIEAVQQANPGKVSPPGYGDRAALVDALQDTNRSLSEDLRCLARSSGLTLPEGLR